VDSVLSSHTFRYSFRTSNDRDMVGSNPIPRTPCTELYPVVRDLTETEYGSSSGSRGGLCCGQMLGSFALEDLALPNVRALQLSNPPESSREQHCRHRSTSQSTTTTDFSSTLQHTFMPATGCFKPISTESSRSVTWSLDTQYPSEPEAFTFDKTFVLTRQVYTN
jgi:hypothetical protein